MTETTLKKRLNVRVAEREKSEIDRAAVLTGCTTSQFVRRTVLAAARQVVRSDAPVRLSQEGSRAFVAAINDPPAPNENLRALGREFRDIAGQ